MLKEYDFRPRNILYTIVDPTSNFYGQHLLYISNSSLDDWSAVILQTDEQGNSKIFRRNQFKKCVCKQYRLSSFKLEVTGWYETEEEAIEKLADAYLKISKCDPPGEHPAELITKTNLRSPSKVSKQVLLEVEEEVYGRIQWIEKNTLNIRPFKKEHWWNPKEGFILPFIEFNYSKID